MLHNIPTPEDAFAVTYFLAAGVLFTAGVVVAVVALVRARRLRK